MTTPIQSLDTLAAKLDAGFTDMRQDLDSLKTRIDFINEQTLSHQELSYSILDRVKRLAFGLLGIKD